MKNKERGSVIYIDNKICIIGGVTLLLKSSHNIEGDIEYYKKEHSKVGTLLVDCEVYQGGVVLYKNGVDGKLKTIWKILTCPKIKKEKCDPEKHG